MRLSAVFLRIAIFIVAAFVCVIGARLAVGAVEDRSRLAVQEALVDGGYSWAAVQSDGLQIVVEGVAPDEATRFRAISVAGSVVDSSRVIDNMDVAASGIDIAPDFAIEMLRNDDGVRLIGLAPAVTDRDDVAATIRDFTQDGQMTDLLDVADYPAPPLWSDTMKFALQALELLPRSKISVTPGHLEITAISESAEQRAAWEATLARRAPRGVTYSAAISAPRPVITPFTLRFVRDGTGATLDACSADTEAAQSRILGAAQIAGLTEPADCTIGLGVPSTRWGEAASMALGAVSELGGGTLTITDADITLIAPVGTPEPVFDQIIGRLGNRLPPVFSLDAQLPAPPETGPAAPPEFVATLSPEGALQLRGKVADPLMNITAQNFAMARFEGAQIDMATRVADDGALPGDWSVRVLSGIEALSHLAHGAVVVRPDQMAVSGRTGSQTAPDDISRMLIAQLGAEAPFDIAVTYDEALDPIAALPTPEECVAKISDISTRLKINFEPGSDTLVSDARRALDEIADVLRRCPRLELEIAGYTDNQGGEEMNLRLSQNRANAVVTALRARRVPTSSFTAVGYGEADPVADNGTAAGREANRRIEFSLATVAAPETPEPEAPDAGAPTATEAAATQADDDSGAAAVNVGEAPGRPHARPSDLETSSQ